MRRQTDRQIMKHGGECEKVQIAYDQNPRGDHNRIVENQYSKRWYNQMDGRQ